MPPIAPWSNEDLSSVEKVIMRGELKLLVDNAPKLAAGGRYLVCYSGGADSTALLHLLSRTSLRPLHALHVNHALQSDAAAWALHCQECCQTFKVPLEILNARVNPEHPQGPEAAARTARYEVLRTAMQAGDVLILAHHRDDQAETVLLRLLRGSGVDGLNGMRRLSRFEPGWLWRPLLNVSRAALRSYAKEHHLRWVEDPHNLDVSFTRVWLRRQILPALEARQPGVAASLARLSGHAADHSELAKELAQLDLVTLANGETLDLEALQRLSPHRQRNALRCWLRNLGIDTPTTAMLNRLQEEVIDAAADADPILRLGRYEIRRHRSTLHVLPILPPPPAAGVKLTWHRQPCLSLPPGCGELRADRPPPRPLLVRFARPGERLRPARSPYHQRLKTLFQDAGVPTWLRPRIPVVELDSEVAWLPALPGSTSWCRFCAEHYWYPEYRPFRWSATADG